MTKTPRLVLWAALSLLLLAGIALFTAYRLGLPFPGLWDAPHSEASFRQWLGASAAHQREFAEFERFLAAEGVAGVVPSWQLTRGDSNPARRCDRPEFLIPPSSEWPNIVAPLKIVRDHIKPALGKVEVVSAYRTRQFNDCIGGADGSKHLGFHALDMIALEEKRQRRLFTELCRIRGALGPASKFGLGAYFDRKNPGWTSGRFHVDASGYRSWGLDYRAASSPCNMLT